ncbi:MAG TPA: hypothetical protein VEH84_11265 [Alphaproteobacteria bacterium]|nr:hypothetical protein [Alphaproteobacteria bacterium]
MALSAIALCSRALLKLGAAAISSFDDGTAEAEVAGALYAPLRDGLLAAYPWRFATGQAELVRLAQPPLADFAHAFALPGDFLRALSAGGDGRGRGAHYRIAGGRLLSDAEAVTLTYLYRPAEADLPAHFDLALIARLAAEFCLPLTENSSRAETLARLAEAELKRAYAVDRQQDAPARFEDFTLVEVRR